MLKKCAEACSLDDKIMEIAITTARQCDILIIWRHARVSVRKDVVAFAAFAP
jgi:hypothetical protein